jgi:RNAse (barnase) inhibitor barstar
MTDAISIVKAPERLWRADGDGGTLQATLAAAGVGEVALVDGKKARDKAAFMREVARALKFPDYFGANWDAFAECLDDLHWKDVPIFVVVAHGDALLADEPGELDPFLHIVEDAFADDPELPNSALKVIVAAPPTAAVIAAASQLGLAVGQV